MPILGPVRVYIAGPITKGDLQHNINQASEAFERLALAGLAPFCPQWSAFAGPCSRPYHISQVVGFAKPQPNKLTHADWLRVDLAWVRCASAVLRLPGESVGADA
ncbi:MAG TPA: hypothetical protein VGE74_11710, partial [Gemmata sp.]